MSEFLEAFDTGIEAAHHAEKNKAEIAAMFKTLDADVSTKTDGKINIIRGERNQEKRPNTTRFILAPEYMLVYAIIAKNSETTKERIIAEYKEDDKGYPIKIIWGNQEVRCWDKASLTKTLKQVLAAPTTGKAFLSLLNES